jgi:hypothetical protein
MRTSGLPTPIARARHHVAVAEHRHRRFGERERVARPAS